MSSAVDCHENVPTERFCHSLEVEEAKEKRMSPVPTPSAVCLVYRGLVRHDAGAYQHRQ